MNLPFEAAVLSERNRDLVYENVIKAIQRAADENGISKSDIAKKLGKPQSQISRWLSGPSNWTLDTVSHLLYAVDATMDYSVVFNRDRDNAKVKRLQTTPSATPRKLLALTNESDGSSGSSASVTELRLSNYG